VYLEFIPAITPNGAFTPNGDGYNEYWKIKFIDKFTNNQVMVFNRWGLKVFEQKGYSNDDNSKAWDGRDKNGKELPSGTYYYVIILNEAGFEPITGSITIIR
jgi:gliding motility-associated-like protein